VEERTRGDAIEVFLTWGVGAGACVLAVAYVRPGGRYTAREVGVVTWEGFPCVVPSVGARLWIDGHPAPAEGTPLVEGETVAVSAGELTIRSRLVQDEAWAASPEVDRSLGLPRGLALSVLAHVAFFALLALGLSRRAGGDREITPEQIVRMRALLAASAERAPPDERMERTAVERASRHEVASGWQPTTRPAEATPVAPPPGREPPGGITVVAPSGAASPRAAERAEAAGFGMVGLVQALRVDPGEPVPWKDALASLGAHEAGIHAMFDDPSIEKAGVGGLTLSGTGEGGGGKAGGIDLPEAPGGVPSWSKLIDDLPPVPFHDLPGRSLAGPVRTRAEMRADPGLNQEAIRGVIRANAGRIQDCYQAGLRRNPALAGRVIVGFTVNEAGAVAYAKDDGSDLPDPSVRECIVRTFYSFGFPAPKGGMVTVKYPFVLKPRP
jgi:hypothetical protein